MLDWLFYLLFDLVLETICQAGWKALLLILMVGCILAAIFVEPMTAKIALAVVAALVLIAWITFIAQGE